MRYLGNKAKYAHHIISAIAKDSGNLQSFAIYFEPFAGSCGMLMNVRHPNRVANDLNHYVMDFLDYAVNKGWTPPEKISVKLHNFVKKNRNLMHPALVGYVGTACSFAGMWMAAPARNKKQDDPARDYTHHAPPHLLQRQVKKLQGTKFISHHYLDFTPQHFAPNTLIYCDPPYSDESSIAHYGSNEFTDKPFQVKEFRQWTTDLANYGHTVYVSDYLENESSVPANYEIIWTRDIKVRFAAVQKKTTKGETWTDEDLARTECLYRVNSTGDNHAKE